MGVILPLAGRQSSAGGNGGDGYAATAATLNLPCAVAVGPLGDIFIADTNNLRIRKVLHWIWFLHI